LIEESEDLALQETAKPLHNTDPKHPLLVAVPSAMYSSNNPVMMGIMSEILVEFCNGYAA
jgi:hypothetical protein